MNISTYIAKFIRRDKKYFRVILQDDNKIFNVFDDNIVYIIGDCTYNQFHDNLTTKYYNKHFAYIDKKIKLAKLNFKRSDVIFIGNISNTDINIDDIIIKKLCCRTIMIIDDSYWLSVDDTKFKTLINKCTLVLHRTKILFDQYSAIFDTTNFIISSNNLESVNIIKLYDLIFTINRINEVS
jgi:hypothetical protein